MAAPTATTTNTRHPPRNRLQDYILSHALASSPHALPIPAYLAANHPTVTNPMASAAVFYHRYPSSSSSSRGKGSPKLLLVRRAPADFLPLRWELPGGSADAGEGGDASVVAAAARELWEETGLVAAEVVRHVGAREFDEGAARRWRADVFEVAARFELASSSSSFSNSADPGGQEGGAAEQEAAVTRVSLEYKSSAPDDDDDDDDDDDGIERDQDDQRGVEQEDWPVVRLDPAEHVAHLWAGEDEVRAGWCGGVELVLTDPDWRRLMLRAFELHRTGCGC